jgi:deazaflavin-dependent oxidoreductase (nitroreductase family)
VIYLVKKRHLVNRVHRVINPVARRLPGQVVLETTGRATGEPRRSPIGGRVVGDELWFVSMHGEASNYIRNIKADNAVRVRIHGRWRTGTAFLLPDDNALARNAQMPLINRTANRRLGTDLLTVRIDLDRPRNRQS